MRATLPLGRWAGVPVGANIGVIVILLLVGLGLGLWHFPAVFPGYAGWAYVLAGSTAALLLVLSILIHELSHAVVAQAHGIKVDRIVLWLLGGMAQLRGEPRSPGVDFAVAAVGPASSVLLGAVFGAATVGAVLVDAPQLAAATMGYLAVINILLAVFNLVPAAPLDGGRVLRAALWWRTGDRARAAVFATRAGRGFGVALIIFGIGAALLLAWLGGVWLALIGWFLVHAAGAEQHSVMLSERLGGVRVGNIMSAPAVTADPDTRIAQFVDDVVLQQRHSTYPLADGNGRLVGLVTLNRIRKVPPQQRGVTTLREIACPPAEVPVTRVQEPLVELLPRMVGCADGRAVVLDDQEQVIGVISPQDVAQVAAAAELRPGA